MKPISFPDSLRGWDNLSQKMSQSVVGRFMHRTVSWCAAIGSSAMGGRIASILKVFSDNKSADAAVAHRLTNGRIASALNRQEAKSAYKRETLETLDPEKANPPRPIGQPPGGIDFYTRRGLIYAFNAEGIRDHGWGCAWRTIQTCLSGCGIDEPIVELFHFFGRESELSRLYKDKYPEENLDCTHPFAPYDLASGWAEPFIGQMALHFYGISASLESLNGLPRYCHAPTQVFHRQPMDFISFRKRLENHFKTEHPAPVMIDDGSNAVNILGIGSKANETTLWIADPHILEGVNNRRSADHPVYGMYTITLDDEGKRTGCSLDGADRYQVSLMSGDDSYRNLSFDKRRWMVLLPEYTLGLQS